MREIRYTHPDQPDYVVELQDGVDPASITPPGDDWTAEEVTGEETTVAEVPVGDSINLTPEPSADVAAPAEPDNTDQTPSDAPKEK